MGAGARWSRQSVSQFDCGQLLCENDVSRAPYVEADSGLLRQIALVGLGQFLFPSDKNGKGHQNSFKTAWQKTLRRARIPYFRIYDLRSTYATRLSAGGVADEWVTQMLRQGDAQVFKKYSQMKVQMKREALEKINRQASEMPVPAASGSCTVAVQ
jgi:integrase